MTAGMPAVTDCHVSVTSIVQRLVIALLDAGTDMIHNIKLRTMPTMVFTLLLVRPTIPMVTPLPLAMVILLLDLILAFLLLKMYG
jgi:hypothetical protein